MQQVRIVNSYALNKNIISLFLDVSIDMSGVRSLAGRLFHTRQFQRLCLLSDFLLLYYISNYLLIFWAACCRKLQAFEMRCYRRTLKVCWKDRVTGENVAAVYSATCCISGGSL